MTDINVPLLRKGVEWVEEQARLDPDSSQWHQSGWVTPEFLRVNIWDTEPGCGSAYCLAGYIGQLVDPRYENTAEVDGVHVSEVAVKALGLDGTGPLELFVAQNTAEDVRRIAEELVGGPL
jgi:hypothetical protein